MKRETNAKLSKIESECDAVREDLKVLSQKIEVGLKQCATDSEKLMKSVQNATKTEIETIKKGLDGKVGDKMSDGRSFVVSTRSEILKFVEDKFEVDDLDCAENPWVQVADKHVDATLSQVANEVEAMQKALQESRAAAMEEQDKEARRNNIIMYRVPESDAALLNDRNTADKRLVEQVLFR